MKTEVNSRLKLLSNINYDELEQTLILNMWHSYCPVQNTLGRGREPVLSEEQKGMALSTVKEAGMRG